MVADPVLDDPDCRPQLPTSWAEPLPDDLLQKYLGSLDPPPASFEDLMILNLGRQMVHMDDVPEERVGRLQRRYCFVNLQETELPVRHIFSARREAGFYISRQVLMRVRPSEKEHMILR